MCFLGFFLLNMRLADFNNNPRKKNTNHNHKSRSFSSNVISFCDYTTEDFFIHGLHTLCRKSRISLHLVNIVTIVESGCSGALRKDGACNFCNGKIFARNCNQMQMCSRCVECYILDNFNYCECCGLKTIKQLRITKTRTLSNLFPKNQTAPVAFVKSLAASIIQPDKSPDLFDEFRVNNEDLALIEESLVTDDVSSDNEKKQESIPSVSSDFISIEEDEKENILNGWQTPEET